MKYSIVTLLLFFTINAMAQEEPDAILGTYFNPKKSAKIEIYKNDEGYEGKIVWLAQPKDSNGNPRTDSKNPKKELRDRPLIGLVNLTGLNHGNGKWSKGKMYNAERGGSIDFKVLAITNAALSLKISKGFFSKEIKLKRTKN